jgi:hypothetical protein
MYTSNLLNRTLLMKYAGVSDLALLHEGPCEAAAAVRVARALRGVSCATEAVNCQEKCGSYIRIYFRCSSDGKSECSCLPGVASCDDEEDKCRAKCSNDFLHFTCSTFRGVAQQTSCTCKSSPTPVRADCGAYGRSCEWTCGSKATNVLCQLDHDNIINKSCTCGADSTTARTTARTPNSADRTQMESTAALACVLLWMKNWMTC